MLKKNQSLGKIDINDKKSKEERNIEDYKIQLVSKDSLIKELEFQISDLSSESRLLKIVNDTQNQTINQLEQQLVQQRDLELILEESNEEIQKLKTLLQKDDLKQDNLKSIIEKYHLIYRKY